MLKKWSKKFLAAATAAIMAISVVGCGNTGQMDTAEAEAEALLKKSQKTMATVESMAAEMVMEINMTLGNEVMETTTVANILTKQSPLQMQMDMSVVMADGIEVEQMKMYAEEVEGKLMSYVYSSGAWQTMEMGELGQYDVGQSMELYLSNIESFKASGEETINGTQATKIEGVIAGDALEEAILGGVANTAESMGVTEEQLQEMYADMGDLPITVWIDAEGYMLKYEMDMTGMMQKIIDAAMKSVGEAEADSSISVAKTSISMVCKDFNAIGEIVIPAEAKSAKH